MEILKINVAFLKIASMESQVLIANKTLQPLSEEQLVDCDRKFNFHNIYFKLF